MPKDNVNAETQEPEGIELGELFSIFFSNIKLIIISTLVVGLIFFSVSNFLITPLYTASVSIYVNNAKTTEMDKINSADIAASQSLVNTYIAIIQSDTVLSEVADQLNEKNASKDKTKKSDPESPDVSYTPDMITGMMSTNAVSGTEIFKVSIRNKDPKEAADIANKIAEAALLLLPDYIEGSSVKIVDYAKSPANPSSPNIMRNTAIGLLIGLILSVMYSISREFLDTRVKTESDIESMFGLPVLGKIPDFVYTSQESKNPYEIAAKSGGKKK